MPTVAQVPLKYHPVVGGVERVVEQQGAILTAGGYRVTVLTTALNEHNRRLPLPAVETSNGLAVRRFPAWNLPGIKYPLVGGLAAHLRRQPYDVVHAHSFWYANLLAARWARRRRGGKLVVQPHFDLKGGWFHTAYRKLLGQWLLAADAVILVSHYERELLCRAGLPLPASFLLPNPVDLEELQTPVVIAGLPEKYGLRDRRLYLNVGRVSTGKGIDILIAAARQLRARRSPGRIVVVGPDAGGLAAARAVIAREQLTDYLACVGAVPRAELIALYQSAALYLHASRYEAFGVVLIEAMAAGVPVIAPAASAIPEISPDGIGGRLYPPEDVAALTGLVERLERDEPLRLRLARGARDRAQAFSLARYRGRLLELYARLLAG